MEECENYTVFSAEVTEKGVPLNYHVMRRGALAMDDCQTLWCSAEGNRWQVIGYEKRNS